MAYMKDSTGRRLDSIAVPSATEVARSSAPTATAVATPTGFTWTDHPLVGKLFVDQYGVFSSTLDPATRKYVGGVTYYVDVVSGLDTNAGTSDVTALQSIAAAVAKSDVGTVMVKGYGVANPYYRGRGFNNAAIAKNINIIGYGGTDAVITTHDVLAFTLTTSQTNTYQTTRASVSEVFDMVNGAPGTRLVKKTSIAEVEATAGSWWQNGTTLHVHAIDNRNLSTTNASRIWAVLAVNNFKNVGDYTTYLENLTFYGGTDALRVEGATGTGAQVTLNNVGTHGSQLTWNNVALLGCDAVLLNCETTRSGGDGYNYHSLNGKIPRTVEVNCRATDCGHTTSDQCSTIHDGGKIIRVGGTYRRAIASTVADVNAGTESWNLGCVADGAGDSFANWQIGLVTDTTGTAPKLWLHACHTGNATWGAAAYGLGVAVSRGSRIERPNVVIASY